MTRVESLQLVKYGHFDENTVEFGPGLTVVYGPNEAGKSTLLDGLTDFLWGIARNTKRAYTVQPKVMELLGCVTIDGSPTTYRRRLGDLSDSAGTKVPAPWGESADKDMWQHGFGLDHARLLAGGKLIVDGDDDPAGIEFLAETGIDIDAVRTGIEARMEELYKFRRGAKCVVREITARITGVDASVTTQLSSAREVVELRAALADLEVQIAEATAVEGGLRVRSNRTQELLRCLDNAGKLRDAQKLVEQTRAAGRCLTRDEVERIDEAIAMRDKSRKKRDQEALRLQQLAAKEATLAPNEELLAQGSSIDALVQQMESRRADQVAMKGERAATAEAKVRTHLEALGVVAEDVATDYRRVLLAKDRVEQLDRAADEAEVAAAEVARQQKSVERARAKLDGAGSATAGEVDDSLAEARLMRDRAWHQVREPWISGDLPDPETREQMATAVGKGIVAADVVAESQAEFLTAAAEVRGLRSALADALQAEQEQLAIVEAKAAQASEMWATLVADTGLQAGTDPAAWRLRAANLHELEEAWKDWQQQVEAATAAAGRYECFAAEVAGLAQLLTSAGEDPFGNLDRLRTDLEKAKTDAAKLAEVSTQREDAQTTHDAAESARTQAEAQIAAIARDDDPAELSERSHTLHGHEAKTEQLLAMLRDQKDPGSDLDALLAELADTDAVTLEQRQESLQGELSAASETLLALSTQRGARQKAMADVKAKGSVADLRAEREDLVGQLREAVEEYRSLFLQLSILDAYRESVADDSGTGILQVAGEYLSRLTEGRYTGFAIETEGQKQVLRIVARGDAGGGAEEVRTTELSTGTEYQVYFALRLAGIAAKQSDRVAAGQPTLPVVLDDVLLAYDDYRTKAALGLLAELGQQFQIVVMTHSRSVLADAQGLDGVATVELAGPVAVAG
jgi:uncharacterized protein YhaN